MLQVFFWRFLLPDNAVFRTSFEGASEPSGQINLQIN
jgi:hypothetical protein